MHLEMQMEMQLLGWREEAGTTAWGSVGAQDLRVAGVCVCCGLMDRRVEGPSVPFLQHIGLPMFAADRKPKRIQQMSLGVLNLPRNALLDWCFGHSLVSCHVEHHLFPSLSDNMCLKVSQSLPQHGVGILSTWGASQVPCELL